MPRRDDVTDEEIQAAIEALADAVIAKLEAPLAVHRAAWDLRNGLGVSVGRISRGVYGELQRRGLPPERINGAGISHDRIQVLVKGPRP